MFGTIAQHVRIKRQEIRLHITFGDATYHHVEYVGDIKDKFNLGLDFLKENHFKMDFKKNGLYLGQKK